jgi:hypothetical protein
VSPGTCGDFDGDGRIGTAEDTDGADRIFGTLKAALGPGTGAAAGTGANQNGKIIIVASGRYAESLFIGQPIDAAFAGTFGGSATAGNVTIEAAPGVNADIDAVLQGDPAGGNNTRQAQFGIFVYYFADSGPTKVVTLRNLQVRNFNTGIDVGGSSRVNIDHCRLELNQVAGIRATDSSSVAVSNTQSDGNGFRIPITGPPNPGDGLRADAAAQVRISDSVFRNNAGAGIRNASTGGIVVFKVASYFNTGGNSVGSIVVAPDHNFSNQ